MMNELQVATQRYWRISKLYYDPEAEGALTVFEGLQEANKLLEEVHPGSKLARLCRGLSHDIICHNKEAK